MHARVKIPFALLTSLLINIIITRKTRNVREKCRAFLHECECCRGAYGVELA